MAFASGCANASVLAILLAARGAVCFAAQETVTYTYDAAGRLVTAAYADGPTNAAIHYRYDANGNITNQVSLAANDTATDFDGDALSDLRELVYFGDLDENGAGDPDGDTLVNSNEFALGGNPTMTNTDGDAHSDLDEYIAGTALNDAESYFQVEAITATGAVARLQWAVNAGRSYQLQAATGLVGSVTWTNRDAEVPAASDGVLESVQPATTTEFFRVRVRVTP